jgi:uncharacterized cupin superfamily protein
MASVPRFNVLTGELDAESTRDGCRWRGTRVGDRLGSSRIGASVYELEAGERTFPYHYHHGVEEWLYVIDGSPTLRTPAGERRLRAGDITCFPAGPDGAHTIAGPGRIMLFSANREPSISVYPDSDKIGPRPGATGSHANSGDRLDFRRTDAVDYWDGE